MGFRGTVSGEATKGAFASYYADVGRKLERAGLEGTHRAGELLKRRIRDDMAGAGLGRLGQAFTTKSDKDRGGIQKRYTNGGFSVSSTLYVRSRSERTLGAIESYTQGSEIRPVRSRWLWFPTDEVQRVAGAGANRRRLTPGNWSSFGLDRKIGPLVYVKSVNGNPLLVVQNVGSSALGVKSKLKSLTKRGQPRKGQVERKFVVAFVGIPRTSRAARINVEALAREALDQLPLLIRNALERI